MAVETEADWSKTHVRAQSQISSATRGLAKKVDFFIMPISE